jgi:hypothetical protein
LRIDSSGGESRDEIPRCNGIRVLQIADLAVLRNTDSHRFQLFPRYSGKIKMIDHRNLEVTGD